MYLLNEMGLMYFHYCYIAFFFGVYVIFTDNINFDTYIFKKRVLSEKSDNQIIKNTRARITT